MIATALLLFVINLKPAFSDHMHRDLSFPWEWLPFAVVYRNGILFPWGQFYYIPELLESPLATTPDLPDPPDPVPQKGKKKSKKGTATKTAVKKTKNVNSEQEFEQENEYENPQPRKKKRKRQRKGQRKRKGKGQRKAKTAR